MHPSWHAAVDPLVSELRGVFGERLRSVVVYGPHADGTATDEPVSCLALVASLTAGDLEACARLASGWKRRGLAVPLLVPEDEFRRSLDAFPLEYGEIVRTHARAFGPDPFDGVTIAPHDLRRACETQAKSHLLHLREAYMEAGGRPSDIAALVTASAPGFAALLRNVGRLHGGDGDAAATAREGARAAGLPERVVADVIALEHRSSLPSTDPARIFPDYLAAVEQLARFVDGWRG